MHDNSSNLLLIFIKNPEKGHVKTRLAASMGAERALGIYKQLLTHTRKVVLQVPAQRQVWYSRFVDEGDAWPAAQFDKRLQQGDTLGERMQYAFKRAFEQGRTRAIIIGSDCGQLQPAHINRAFEVLNEHEVVIGPAEDGGYYLLGMQQYRPVLFENKEWSTSSVCKDTVEDCRRNGYQYALLETLNDVDTEADWEQSGL